MKRRTFLYTSFAVFAVATQACSASFADAILGQLTAQGFAKITVETTWLGRVQILAYRADGMREIILNPRSGEILRDLWTASAGQTAYSLVDPVGSKASAPNSAEASDSATGQSDDTGKATPTAQGPEAGDDSADPAEHHSVDAPERNYKDAARDN